MIRNHSGRNKRDQVPEIIMLINGPAPRAIVRAIRQKMMIPSFRAITHG